LTKRARASKGASTAINIPLRGIGDGQEVQWV
jgi:hypothetical protein